MMTLGAVGQFIDYYCFNEVIEKSWHKLSLTVYGKIIINLTLTFFNESQANLKLIWLER